MQKMILAFLSILIIHGVHADAYGMFYNQERDTIVCGAEIVDTTSVADVITSDTLDLGGDTYKSSAKAFFFTADDTIKTIFSMTPLENDELGVFIYSNTVDSLGNDCPDSCLLANTFEQNGEILLEVDFVPGDYWIAVEGLSERDSQTFENAGPFLLEVQCFQQEFAEVFCGEVLAASTSLGSNSFDGSDYAGCIGEGGVYANNDALIRFVLPFEDGITVELEEIDSIDLDIFLFTDSITPDGLQVPGECIDADTTRGARQGGKVRGGGVLPAGVYWIIVDAKGDGMVPVEGGFNVTITGCEEDYVSIICNEAKSGTTLLKPSQWSSLDYADCVNKSHDGGDVLFQYRVTGGELVVEFSLSHDTIGDLDLILLASDTLDGIDVPGMCIKASDSDSSGLEKLRDTLPIGTYWVLVDSDLGDEANFTLSVACQDMLVAQEVSCGSGFMGNNAGSTSRRTQYPCGSTEENAAEAFYYFDLNVVSTISMTLTPDTSNANHDLFIFRDSIDPIGISIPGDCVASSDTGLVQEEIFTELDSGRYWIIVDGPAVSSGDTFFIEWECMENVFPVELVGPEAALEGDEVMITWYTLSELNSEGFAVQRSHDGVSWEVIQFLNSSGNSTERIDYHVLDRNPLTGSNFYRLQSIDFDGSFEYSAIVRVDYQSVSDWSVYPTLTQDLVTVLRPQGGSDGTYQIFNSVGRLLMSGRILDARTDIDISHLTDGVYFVRLPRHNDQQVIRQIVKH